MIYQEKPSRSTCLARIASGPIGGARISVDLEDLADYAGSQGNTRRHGRRAFGRVGGFVQVLIAKGKMPCPNRLAHMDSIDITYFGRTVSFPDLPRYRKFYARLKAGAWEPATFERP